ncbi:LysR family substrate-binding domain-containing protein [Tsukamurella serpentis]
MTTPPLRLAYVPGATPAKWARIWSERHPDHRLELVPVSAAGAAEAVRSGSVDMALLRLPAQTSGLAVIPLYQETTVAVVPKDHVVTAADELCAADLVGEPVLLPGDDALHWDQSPGTVVEHRPETTADAIELVAAGVGALIVPQSLARLHHRRDLTFRPIADAPESTVALAFTEGQPQPPVEEFVGIVRGRRAGSSRGQTEPAPKRTAREKTLAKQAARAAAGKKATPKRGASAAKRPRRR